MSHHLSRRDRWEAIHPGHYRSVEGLEVRFHKGQWWAEVAYQVQQENRPAGELPSWQARLDRLGPFKRPRNAMVEAERHVTMLRNRHQDGIQLKPVSSPFD